MRRSYPTPPRSCLARAEHGNPGGSGHADVSGALTVRKADHPAGTGWPKKRTPAAERRQETGMEAHEATLADAGASKLDQADTPRHRPARDLGADRPTSGGSASKAPVDRLGASLKLGCYCWRPTSPQRTFRAVASVSSMNTVSNFQKSARLQSCWSLKGSELASL